jgi:hypothetical protein
MHLEGLDTRLRTILLQAPKADRERVHLKILFKNFGNTLGYNTRLSNLAFPITSHIKPILLQIRLKPRILGLQIPLLIRDKEPHNEAPHNRKSSPIQEHSLLPLLSLVGNESWIGVKSSVPIAAPALPTAAAKPR